MVGLKLTQVSEQYYICICSRVLIRLAIVPSYSSSHHVPPPPPPPPPPCYPPAYTA